MIHRLHSVNDLSWERWVQQNACVASLTGEWRPPWQPLADLEIITANSHSHLTTISLGDGRTISWHDVWNGNDSLAGRFFPEHFSHCQQQEITVHSAFQGQLQLSLAGCMTVAAAEQLQQVVIIMGQHQLTAGGDKRQSSMLKTNRT